MATVEQKTALERFYEEIAPLHLSPLWTVLHGVITREPVVAETPHLWRWHEMRGPLYKAAELIGTDEAERRVLVLENPGDVPHPAITQTLYAGLQIIRPGEIARTHRHTANALRLIVEGEGAYTAVNGEKTLMGRGDFVTTPIWAWHDHGNESDRAMVWMDGLDLPFVNRVNGMFSDPYPTETQPIVKPEEDSIHRYGYGFKPGFDVPEEAQLYSPILNYRYETAYRSLKELSRTTTGSPFDGVILQYINPMTGGPVLPTIDATLQLLPKGFATQKHRHTSGSVYCVLEGQGQTDIEGRTFHWEPNDIFVIPSWASHRHVAGPGEDAILFAFNDSPMQRPFGLYREEAVD